MSGRSKTQKRAVSSHVVNNAKIPISLGGATSTLDTQVEYKRKDVSQLSILHASIGKEVDKVVPSIAVFWRIPANDARGNLIFLYNTVVTIKNMSPGTIRCRGARPFGFSAEPTAIAFWESLWPKSLKLDLRPGQTKKLKLTYARGGRLANVGPREVLATDGQCVHVFSLSCVRNMLADSGVSTAGDKDEIALSIEVTTMYESTGSSGAGGSYYTLRSYKDSEHIGKVSAAPVISVPMTSLRCEGGMVTRGWLISASIKQPTTSNMCFGLVKMVFVVGDNQFTTVDGLDKSKSYTFGQFPVCYNGRAKCTRGGEPPFPDAHPYNADKQNRYPLTTAGWIRWVRTNLINTPGEFSFTDPVTGDVEYYPEGWYLFSTHETTMTYDGKDGVALFDYLKNVKDKPSEIFPCNPFGLSALPPTTQFTAASDGVSLQYGVTRFDPTRVGGVYPAPSTPVRICVSDMYGANWSDQLLQAVTVIISVMKTAISIAAVLGLAEIHEDDAPPSNLVGAEFELV